MCRRRRILPRFCPRRAWPAFGYLGPLIRKSGSRLWATQATSGDASSRQPRITVSSSRKTDSANLAGLDGSFTLYPVAG